MDPLSLLRILTLAIRVALAIAILYVVVRRRGVMPALTLAGWMAFAVLHGVLAFDNALLEALAVLRRGLPPDSLVHKARLIAYHATYLLHAVMSAILPAVLAVVFLEAGRMRRAWIALAAVSVIIGLAAIPAGAMHSWDRLLSSTRILSFIAIGGYLGFWASYLAGRLRGVDRYLALFLAIRTVFILLLPVQEVILQVVGRQTAARIWHVHQFIQLATGVAQLAVVFALLWATRGARPGRRTARPVTA